MFDPKIIIIQQTPLKLTIQVKRSRITVCMMLTLPVLTAITIFIFIIYYIIHQDTRWFFENITHEGWKIILPGIVSGWLAFITCRDKTLIFDKNSNRFIYIDQTLLGKKSREYPLYEITGTNLEYPSFSTNFWCILRLLPESFYKKIKRESIHLIISHNLTEIQNVQKAMQDFLHII